MDTTLFLTFYQYIQKHKKMEKYFIFTGKILPNLVILAYFLFLLYILKYDREALLRITMVPLFTLFFVTLLRKLINRKRPFELYSIITPLTHNRGNSFPSRHTASAVIIACSIGYVNIIGGIIFGFIASIIGISRVATGLHFPFDVIAGAAISLLFGYFGFIYI